MKISAPVLALILSAAPCLTVCGEVVRPAPQFAFSTAAGESRTLKEVKGQPVLLLLADSPTRSAFRAQLRELEKAFDRLSIRKTLISAAFKQDGGGEVRSNIPVTLLPDGARVCEAYGL